MNTLKIPFYRKIVPFLVGCIFIVISVSLTGTTQAATLDIGLSTDNISLSAERTFNDNFISRFAKVEEEPSRNLVGRLAGIYHKRNGSLAELGLKLSDEYDYFSGSLGVKAVIANLRSDANMAWGVAVGGGLSIHLRPELRAKAEAYYAPSITSFNQTDNALQWNAAIAYAPAAFTAVNQAELSIGYKKTSVKMNRTGNHDLQNGFFIGLSFNI